MKRIWIAATLTAGALAVPATPAVAQVVTCNGAPATITGTAGADTISGTAGRDVIAALGGDDNVSGLAGNDLVCLGPGNDTFRGGAGDDIAFGGPGDDRLAVAAVLDGADRFSGQEGVDTARYSDRTVVTNVSLDGVADDGAAGEGDNILADVENFNGGQGINRFVGSDVRNVVIGGPGADTILGAGGNDSLRGEGGNDTIAGQGGDDTVFGDAGDDTVVAAAGADGADVVEGGSGTDTANYSARFVALTISLDGVANDGSAGEGDDLRFDVENVIGGTAGDQIVARNIQVRSSIFGGPGNDNLDVRDNAPGDVALGETGDDVTICDVGDECHAT